MTGGADLAAPVSGRPRRATGARPARAAGLPTPGRAPAPANHRRRPRAPRSVPLRALLLLARFLFVSAPVLFVAAPVLFVSAVARADDDGPTTRTSDPGFVEGVEMVFVYAGVLALETGGIITAAATLAPVLGGEEPSPVAIVGCGLFGAANVVVGSLVITADRWRGGTALGAVAVGIGALDLGALVAGVTGPGAPGSRAGRDADPVWRDTPRGDGLRLRLVPILVPVPGGGVGSGVGLRISGF